MYIVIGVVGTDEVPGRLLVDVAGVPGLLLPPAPAHPPLLRPHLDPQGLQAVRAGQL